MDYKETYEKILGEYRQVFERVDQDNMRAFIDEVKAHDRIFLIGVGREGMATRAFAMRLMHMGKEIHWIWDDTTPSIGEGDLLIATLGDGRIGHINYICERAKEAGAMIYVVTGSPSGDTAKNVADKVFFVPAAVYRGTDDVVPSFQPMGNLFELNLVFYELHKRMHKDGLKIYDTEIKTYCTCMEMGGFSITFLKLDDELKPYYDAPCYSPYYAKGSVSGEAIEDDGEDEEIEFDENDVKPAEIVRSKEGELTELNAEDTRNMLLYIADKIIANKPYLTEIDSAIGDGDHGIGMAGGMQKAKKKLLKMAGEENAYQLFETAGQAMLMSMGGASGVIFGSLYLAGAKGMDPKSVITSKDLADMEKKSLEAIQERGGAQVGDKTMVDALSPAVDALAANADKGLLEMLKAAEASAKQGVEDTKKYVAKFGRAKSLLERAIGHQDAGATSVYLIFQGMREFVEGKLAKTV